MFEEYENYLSNPTPLSVEAAGELILGHRHIPADMTRPPRERAEAEQPDDSCVDFINDMTRAMACLPQTVGEVSRAARIAALERAKASVCAAQAKEAYGLEQDVVARHEDDGVYKDFPARGVGAEVALARMDAQYLGPRFSSYAKSMIEHMPYTFDALQRGELKESRSMLIVRETNNLDPGVRELIDREIAGEQGSLEGVGDNELRSRIRKIVLAFDNTEDMIKHGDAENRRRISLTPTPDGMMRISGVLPIIQGVAMKQALLAKVAKRRAKGDARTDQQIMADTTVERITGQEVASRPGLSLSVSMTDRSLLEGDSEPAFIQGYGTISAEYVRRMIARDPKLSKRKQKARVWMRRLYTSPTTGQLVAMDSKARIVPQKLKDLINIRDQHCRTPYCGAPIRHIDHIFQFAKGGRTTESNTDGRCARCNQTKETSGWEEFVVIGPRHTILIKTPSGQTYRSIAPPPPGTPAYPPESDMFFRITSP
ncbi:MAG: DUF222 domain-containing protein [Paeniglutamicibacter terrestris]